MNNAMVVTECTTNSPEAFDLKINNWVEGILLTLDADASAFAVRGAKRPYASEYAKMLKKISEKTEKMPEADRARQALEIRLDWKNALEKARTMEMHKDADFTFQLPGAGSKLVVVDETPFYNREKESPQPGLFVASLTEEELKAVRALKDLKVGDCVAVGYHSGVLNDTAYAVIKANKRLDR